MNKIIQKYLSEIILGVIITAFGLVSMQFNSTARELMLEDPGNDEILVRLDSIDRTLTTLKKEVYRRDVIAIVRVDKVLDVTEIESAVIQWQLDNWVGNTTSLTDIFENPDARIDFRAQVSPEAFLIWELSARWLAIQ